MGHDGSLPLVRRCSAASLLLAGLLQVGGPLCHLDAPFPGLASVTALSAAEIRPLEDYPGTEFADWLPGPPLEPSGYPETELAWHAIFPPVRLPPVIHEASAVEYPEVPLELTSPVPPAAAATEEPIPVSLIAAPRIPAARAAEWQRPPAAQVAAQEQANQSITRAKNLARRGATFSAKAELERALETLAGAHDAEDGTANHLQLLREGWLAWEEAGDFTPPLVSRRSGVDVRTLVARHRSKVLTVDEATYVSAADASRLYYEWAEDRLARAVGRSPLAAQAFHGLGKLNLANSAADADVERIQGPRALSLQRVALRVDPQHAAAAHELGMILAHYGRWPEAREAFRRGATVGNLPESWAQLAQVHERLGEKTLAQQAQVAGQRAQQAYLASNPQVVTAPNGLTVHWVDKATFERGSAGAGTAGASQGSGQQTPAASMAPHTASQPRVRTGAHW